MAWLISEDPHEFAAAAGPFLRGDPAMHTVQLTALEMLRGNARASPDEPRPLFGCWRSAAGVEATFVQNGSRPLELSVTPAGAIDPLARLLAERRQQLPGVSADQATAHRFAAAWRLHTGATSQLHRRQRLHRLVELVWPSPPPPGRPRVAGVADRELLIAWNEAFGRDIGGPRLDVVPVVDYRIGYGGYTLWETGGEPVALAGNSLLVAGMVRVGPVYTPPEHRRRGYGGAATAAVTEAALRDGASEVVLFTDLANPTSNALYQRLGYRAIADQVMLHFTPRGSR
jgi:RimJ/RimL family protein N-acetyltransferase